MVTLKQCEAYLKVKRFIGGHNEQNVGEAHGPTGPEASPCEAEIISRLINEGNYVPSIIESNGAD